MVELPQILDLEAAAELVVVEPAAAELTLQAQPVQAEVAVQLLTSQEHQQRIR
jgi:hypothetical protein